MHEDDFAGRYLLEGYVFDEDLWEEIISSGDLEIVRVVKGNPLVKAMYTQFRITDREEGF